MSEPRSFAGWKRVALRSFFGGIGFAITLSVIAGGGIWYESRPKPIAPWNSRALNAKFDTMEFSIGGADETTSYPVDFYYNVRNNTDQTYQFVPADLMPMAVLTDGNALSKDFGHYQSGAASVDGPPFIPPGGTARIAIKVSYLYPYEFTDSDKKNEKKIIESLGHRTDELNGFVIFDEQNHYRIDLPRGWQDTKSKMESESANGKDAPRPCPPNDPLGLNTRSKCVPLPAK